MRLTQEQEAAVNQVRAVFGGDCAMLIVSVNSNEEGGVVDSKAFYASPKLLPMFASVILGQLRLHNMGTSDITQH